MRNPWVDKSEENHYKVLMKPANPLDLHEILEIERKSFPSPWTPRMFLEEFSNPISQSFVAKSKSIDRMILGYIFYQLVSLEMHVLNIAVHPFYRGKGIGFMLLSKSIEKESNSGLARYAFLEVRENNHIAIHLYKKLGFQIIGIEKNYYVKENMNALIMGRNIG